MSRAAALFVVVMLFAGTVGAGPSAPPLADVLNRASAYVSSFVASFSTVVAEEHYVQDSHPAPVSGGLGVGQWDAPKPRHIETRSDFLFVRTDDVSSWLTFRDVFSVDGRAVRDRQARLAHLFETPSRDALEQARRIAEESYRYSIGPRGRTLADPLLALIFLEPAFRSRFAFALAGIDTSHGGDVWIIKYEERARPTIVRDLDDRNAPVSGRFWIEGATGRVVQTELKIRGGDCVMTVFGHDERLQISVPVEMRDVAWVGETSVTGTATYSNFRRFDIHTEETVH